MNFLRRDASCHSISQARCPCHEVETRDDNREPEQAKPPVHGLRHHPEQKMRRAEDTT